MSEPAKTTREAMLSIGALSRAAGIPIDTLRTWERRYGFPVPERKPSGHRVYSMSFVPRLRRIAQLLALGHRAGDVVAASDDVLAQLASAAAPDEARPVPTGAERVPLEDLLDLVRAFDSDRLMRILLGDWARLTPLDFLEQRIAPLLDAVGLAWQEERLDIRHEHFVSERIGDLLRSLRLPFEERARGGWIVLATLSGERHGLGLEMAALVLAAAGWRVLYLGTDAPAAQVASVVRDLRARAAGVSLASVSRGARAAQAVAQLRAELPRRVELIVGGRGARALGSARASEGARGSDRARASEGARARDGIRTMATLRELDAWARGSLTPS